MYTTWNGLTSEVTQRHFCSIQLHVNESQTYLDSRRGTITFSSTTANTHAQWEQCQGQVLEEQVEWEVLLFTNNSEIDIMKKEQNEILTFKNICWHQEPRNV